MTMIQARFPDELKEVTTITKGSINQLSRLPNQRRNFKDIKCLSPMDKDLNFAPHTSIDQPEVLSSCMTSTPLSVHAPTD